MYRLSMHEKLRWTRRILIHLRSGGLTRIPCFSGKWCIIHSTVQKKAARMRMMLREEDHFEAFVTASKTTLTELILDDFMVRWKEIFGEENESFARFIAGIVLPVEAMLKRCRDLQAAAADRS
jgi:hypothetical protein